jgi:hypothetical protein
MARTTRIRRRHGALAAALTAVLAAVTSSAQAAPPAVFNPLVEAQNFSITQQRQAIYDTPAYQQQLAVDGAASTA